MTTYTHTLTRELTIDEYVGQRIVELRRARGWSCEQLAHQLGLPTRGNIPLTETGKHSMSLRRLQQFADVFEIPVRELLPS